jgi:16S rRNA (uracil1498-N3)-methyltransferase
MPRGFRRKVESEENRAVRTRAPMRRLPAGEENGVNRFFADRSRIHDGIVTVTGGDVNHIRNVLRMHPGEKVLISCGDEWEYTCEILPYDSADQVHLKIVDAQKPGRELPGRIYLFQCLPKSDKMDLIVQKAVELGAFAVVPVSSKRSIVRLDGKKAEAKVRRWNAVAESAAKQSKRMIVPEVFPVCTMEEAFALADREEIGDRLIPYECAENMDGTRRRLCEIRRGSRIAVLIGPEGGFDSQEIREASEHGFSVITLGRRILRTETAGMTMLSILMYLLDS